MNIKDKEELVEELQAHYQQVLEATENLSPFSVLSNEHLKMAGMKTIWSDFVYDPVKKQISAVHRNRREFLPIVERMVKYPEENMIRQIKIKQP